MNGEKKWFLEVPKYSYGNEAYLVAQPFNGYNFINWTERDTLVSTESAISILVKAERYFIANFELESIEISTDVYPENAAIVSGGGNYLYGDSVHLSFQANLGYVFENWTENEAILSASNELSFIAEVDRLVVANFKFDNAIVVQQNNLVRLYPNPVITEITARSSVKMSSIIIFDITGKKKYRIIM